MFISPIWASQPPGTELLNVPHPPKMSHARTFMARRAPRRKNISYSRPLPTHRLRNSGASFSLLAFSWAKNMHRKFQRVPQPSAWVRGLSYKFGCHALYGPTPRYRYGSNAPFAVIFESDPYGIHDAHRILCAYQVCAARNTSLLACPPRPIPFSISPSPGYHIINAAHHPTTFCPQGTSSTLHGQSRPRQPLLLRAFPFSCRCAMSRTTPAPPPCWPLPREPAGTLRLPQPLRWQHAPSACATPCAVTRPSRPLPWRLQSSLPPVLRACPLSRPIRNSQDLLPHWLCMVRCHSQ